MRTEYIAIQEGRFERDLSIQATATITQENRR